MAKRTAIIDIGSNSIRMVIFERTSRFAFHLIHEAKSRVRISEKAYENGGILQDKALSRAFKALKEFQLILKQYKTTKTLIVATSALRDAPNQKAFISKIKKELQLNIKVISGEKEAFLGGLAAANLLFLEEGLTVDIGGGSTELSLFKKRKISKTISLNLGTVRLKELFFDNADITGAKAYIEKELEKLGNDFEHADLIGIGGTLRALSKMIMEKEAVAYQKLHAFSYDINKQENYFQKILKADEKGLKELGVKSERLDIIQPGLLILSLLIKKIKVKQIISSGVGVREGLFLADLLRSQQDIFPHNYNPSVGSILDRFTQNKIDLSKASKLFDLCQTELLLKSSDKHLFLTALRLSHIGKELDFYEAHRHAYYLLLNALNYQFSHADTLLIASLVRYQRKTHISASHKAKYEAYLPKDKTLDALSCLMRLCQVLYGEFTQKIEFNEVNGVLEIKAEETYLLEDKIKSLENNSLLKIKLI